MTLCCHNCSLAKVTKLVPVNVWRLLWQNYSYLPSFSISTSGLSWFSHPYLTITQIVGNLVWSGIIYNPASIGGCSGGGGWANQRPGSLCSPAVQSGKKSANKLKPWSPDHWSFQSQRNNLITFSCTLWNWIPTSKVYAFEPLGCNEISYDGEY